MLASALPPVHATPVVVAAPSAPADHSGPESFARLLGAADARRQAEAQAAEDQRTDSKPAANAAADTAEGSAPTTDAGAAATEQDHAGDDATDTTAAAATGPAVDALALPAEVAPGADAAALLAGLAALSRPAGTEAAVRAAAPGGLRAGLRASGVADAGGADAGTLAATPLGADALATAVGPQRAGGASAAAGGAPDGQVGAAFTTLLRQARAGDGASEQAADAGTPRLQAGANTAADLRAAAAESLNPAAALPATATTLGSLPGSPGAAAAAPGHARLSASPGSPEFASQLGAQLTTFVREGVQHARLELHPLELGPVTVQIAIDGALARVNLAAENATTRQALEQAMPALAGNLREAGLTLSGGGVFEQPRQPQQDGDAATPGRRGGRSERGDGAAQGGPAAVASAPLRRRGVVDLVA